MLIIIIVVVIIHCLPVLSRTQQYSRTQRAAGHNSAAGQDSATDVAAEVGSGHQVIAGDFNEEPSGPTVAAIGATISKRVCTHVRGPPARPRLALPGFRFRAVLDWHDSQAY